MFIQRNADEAKSSGSRSSPRLEFFNRRSTRVFFGLFLVVIGIFLSVPHIVYYSSIDALVNARTMSIVTPIEGVVEGGLPAPGQAIKAGDVVATVRNDRVDRGVLGALRTERESAQRRIVALSAQIGELERLKGVVGARSKAFQEATQRDLAAAMAEQRAILKAQQAVLFGKEQTLQRRRELLRTGSVSIQAFENAQVERDQALAMSETTRRTIERLAVQLQSAVAGVFLGSGGNDVPYNQQRADEIAMHLLDLAARLAELETRVGEIDRQIAAETDRLGRVQEARLAAPGEAVVWRMLAQPAKEVQVGNEIAQLLDCRTAFIDALASESRFDTIRPGDVVRYRLVGSSEFKDGKVAAVRGVAAVGDDRTLAAVLNAARSNEFHVLIELNAADLRGQGTNYCHVGRHAEVRLPQRMDLFGPFKAVWDVI